MDITKLEKDIVNDAAEAVSSVFRVDTGMLLSKNGTRLEMHVRGAMFKVLFDNRYSRAEIARVTGVTDVTIWHWVNRWKKYIEHDATSRRLYLRTQILFTKAYAKTVRRRAEEQLDSLVKEKPAS